MRELKRYKEELVAIALLSILFVAIRWTTIHYWNDAPGGVEVVDLPGGPEMVDAQGDILQGMEGKLPVQYDLRSETETIAWTILRMVIYALFAWLGVRVMMPDGYKWMKQQFQFARLTDREKWQLVIKLFMVFFFGLVALHMSGNDTRQCVLSSARADLGVREATGHNDGARVEAYQKHVGIPAHGPYCAGFVSTHLDACGVDNPRSGWSPDYAAPKDRVWTTHKAVRMPLPADVFTLYFPSMGRVGHTGLVERVDGRYLVTLEGNTNGGGSRDGDGVYRRRRELRKVYAVTNYIHDENDALGAVRHHAAGRLQGQASALHQRDHHTRQRGGEASATRYAHLGAPRKCGAAHTYATGPGAAPGAAEQRKCTPHPLGPQRPAEGGLCMRQRVHQGTPSGYLDARAAYARAAHHGRARGNANRYAALGVVGARKRARPFGMDTSKTLVASLDAAQTRLTWQ